MFIENIDVLREWLTTYLAPLCDADPPALAKYCIALIRKDKPTNELRDDMLQQLEVFLQDNTEAFVSKFITVVQNKSYLSNQTKVASGNVSASKLPSKPTVPLPMATDVLLPPDVTTKTTHSNDAPIVPCTNNGVVLPPTAPPPPLPSAIETPPAPPPPTLSSSESTVVPTTKKDDSRCRKEERDGGRSRRSRSRERRRSRSRGRPGRSKYDDRRRRYSRRSWSRSHSRSPRRSRSPRHSRYSRTSPHRPARFNARSPSRRSPSPKAYSPSQRISPRRSNSPATKKRSHSPGSARSPHSRSPVSPLHKSLKSGHILSPERAESPLAPDDEDGSSPETELGRQKHVSSKRKKHRCKDYDEKGYCMRGDQCPYDHGLDPVVLDFTPSTYGTDTSTTATSLTAASSVTRGVPPIPGRIVTNLTVPPPPHLAARLSVPPSHPPPHAPIQTDSASAGEYTPSDPTLWGSTAAPTNTSLPPPSHFYRTAPPPPLHIPPPIGQPPLPSVPSFNVPPPIMAQPPRELINVNTLAHQSRLRSSLAQRLGPPSKQGSVRDNCSLELRKVPVGLNTITHLNSHFEKFGTIVNIQVRHDNDPEAAIVTFTNHSQANAAYRSTEAVLNNRFIKVFWYNSGLQVDVSDGLQQQSVPNRKVMITDQPVMRHPNKSLDNTQKRLALVPSQTPDVGGPPLGSEAESPTSPTAIAAPDSSTQPAAVSPVAPAKPKLTAAEIKQQQIDAILEQQRQLAAELEAKQKEEEERNEAFKRKLEAYEKTKDLLGKQMEQVKLLVAKLENNKDKMSKTDQKKLLDTIKALQSSVENTKKSMQTALAIAVAARPPSKKIPFQPKVLAKEKTIIKKKQQLDAEMEDYTAVTTDKEITTEREKVGNGTQPAKQPSATSKPSSKAEELLQLQQRLLQLKAEARQRNKARGGSQAALRGRGRGAGAALAGSVASQALGTAVINNPQNTSVVSSSSQSSSSNSGAVFASVDKRPTKLHASGFEREDKDAVLTHFASLGNVIHFMWDGQTPSITVEYATRRHAEKAMTEGRMLGDRLLTLMWVNESRSHALPPVPSTQRYQDLQYDPSKDPAIMGEDHDDDDVGIEELKPVVVKAEPEVSTAVKEEKRDEPEVTEVSIVTNSLVDDEVKKEVKKAKDDDILDPEAMLYDGEVEEVIDDDDDEDKEGTRSWRR